jgi:hypothetical protein
MPEKQPYQWDFDGACCPGKAHFFNQTTFSVGIFQWLPMKRGKGMKRGPVAKRIKGYVSNPEAVYAAARAECERRNGGAQ